MCAIYILDAPNYQSWDHPHQKIVLGRLIYLLVGKWGLSPGVLSVYNVTGERLAEIKQTADSWLFPKFDLYDRRHHVGSFATLLWYQP